MRFPLHGFWATGVLVVFACIQGCASRPPAASAAPPQVPLPVAAAPQPPLVESAPTPVPQPSPQTQPRAPEPPNPPQVEPAPPAAQPPVTHKPARTEPGIAPVERTPAQAKPPALAQPGPDTRPAPGKPASPVVPSPPVEPAPQPLPDPEPLVFDEDAAKEEVIEPEVEVTLEALPINIGEEWVVSASGSACILSTPPIQFDDGQGSSRLQLVFTTQHWLVKTQSDIDLSYSGTGLTVDEGRHFPLDQLVRDTDLVFTKDYEAMTQAFMAARRLEITLGFWPTWPVTETKTITLPLEHFPRAHRAWKTCQSLINAR